MHLKFASIVSAASGSVLLGYLGHSVTSAGLMVLSYLFTVYVIGRDKT